ncbi:hypothetical protein JHK82_044273 [Glycine max]|nr:hypothetical protein JHK86_044623 [Glycine max]KAG4951365.1 hypothetical protein JHK85_045232 [Glycine max]KAG5099221.1 hypothetical protein JHK82_044273 [Glycine max]KAG5107827.1 hypothetical protein JHK84_044734 [Glycine max]KHN27537.1 Hypothetical protein glysoja_018649 [Glycine soja]
MLLPPNNNTTRVTTSDVLDRGGAELKILYFLEKLKCKVARHGSSIITMNGNHEIMNVELRAISASPWNLAWRNLGFRARGLLPQHTSYGWEKINEEVRDWVNWVNGSTGHFSPDYCRGAIWIDVGLSKGCGDGLPEVLEISGNSGLRILTANPLYQNKGNVDDDVGKEQWLGEHGGPRQVEVKA